MVFNFNRANAIEDKAMACAENNLSNTDTSRIYKELHSALLAEQIDVTDFIIKQVPRYGRH